ncbi:MAG: deoxyribonuclease IV [Bacilli bacterium]|nr:deoxyribonuclease IV [Bacilli bacterium]
MDNLIIGSHVSFNKNEQLLGSVKEAISYKSTTFMFYTGAPQNTNRSELDDKLIEEANKLMIDNNIDKSKVIVHAPYIINLANDGKSYDFAINFLKQEISRCSRLGIKNIVLHPGSHVGLGIQKGLDNIVFALKEVLKEDKGVNILLETMAGKGSELGTTTDQLKYIIDNVNSDNLCVCLDTCHLNDSGIDINEFDKYIEDFDKKIGISKIKCIHVNDSLNPISSHKDRHANIGFGTIGYDALIKVIYNPLFKDIPKILETPYVTKDDTSKEKIYPPYKYEIEMIRKKVFNPDMIKQIRKE